MNAIARFVRKSKEIGITGAVKLSFRKAAGKTVKFSRQVTGIEKLQKKLALLDEEIASLHYYLNSFADITKLPPAVGALRELQLCDIELLRIIDSICSKHGWRYWLAYGTLLGAVRHNGFIPWDDDADICMPREDYCELMKELPAILSESPLEVFYSDALTTVFGYKLSTIHCDIFPVDIVHADKGNEAGHWKSLQDKVFQYQKFYRNEGRKLTQEEINTARDSYINYNGMNQEYYAGGGGVELIVHNPEWLLFYSKHPEKVFICRSEYVFPTSTVQFEGYTFPAPNNTHEYLREAYGDYMLFPKTDLYHLINHDGEKIKLEDFVSRHGIDLTVAHEELRDIEKFFMK